MKKQKLINAYKNKNVYITGITGFKGSWLALMLHELGANVYGIGLDPEENNSIFDEAKVEEIANVTIGDITEKADKSNFITSLIESNPDYIFHLAAQPLVSEGYQDPFNTFNTNIMGTVILHEVLRGLRLPADKENLSSNNCDHFDDSTSSCKKISVINVTTDKVYKEKNEPLLEDDKMFGFDPYSLSKTCSDMISTCYRDAMKSSHYISTMRAGNVIGGGDMSKNRIIPDIIKAAINNTPVKVRNPHSVRPYQHVFDALSAYLLIGILQKENQGLQGEYNVGPDIEQTMKTEELLEKMKKFINFDFELNGAQIGKESDYLALNNDKIKSVGWEPVFKTNDMVVKSVSEWYNKFINKEDMQTFTLNQIKEAFNSYE